MAKVARGSEQAMIRLPDGMRDQIKVAADANGRSMNSEIVERLAASFARDSLTDAERRDFELRMRVLLDEKARTKDSIAQAIGALERDEPAIAKKILEPLRWFEYLHDVDGNPSDNN